MAATQVNAANRVQRWSNSFFTEYTRAERFARYTGDDINSIFQVTEDLGKKKGDRITISLIRRLEGNGVEGDNTLEGNEENLDNYGHMITVNQLRNAVLVGEHEQVKTQIDLLDAAKPALKMWSMEKLRDAKIRALMSPSVSNTAYSLATEAEKDAWLGYNTDRIIFGALLSNRSTTDHSASLLNIDNTADKLTPGLVSLAKRQAKLADAHIRPIRTEEDEEWYVMFAGSRAFRDLANNSTMQQANRDGWTRGKDNPLFKGGDLIWDSVIIREIPEIPTITGAGAGGIDVAPSFLCGAQAVGVAWASRPRFIMDQQDWENKRGVAIAEIRGVEKLFYNNLQHGLVTVYTSAVADS